MLLRVTQRRGGTEGIRVTEDGFEAPCSGISSLNEYRGAGSSGKTNSILIVDDTVANLLAFSAVLKKLGCRIVTASGGVEALRCAQKEDFSVILMDVRMPELNGFETAQQLRKREKTQQTPILFMSAFEVPPQHLLSAFVGAEVDFLPSPVDTELLLRKVAPYLRTGSTEESKDPSDPSLQKSCLGEETSGFGFPPPRPPQGPDRTGC